MRYGSKTPFLFLAPALAFLLLFIFYPVINTLALSFYAGEGPGGRGLLLERYKFVGLSNYEKLITDEDFLMALRNNIIWIAIHVPTTTFLGLVLAVLLRNVRGATVIKSILFIGMVIPMVVGAILLLFIYDTDAGVINAVLKSVGLKSFVRNWIFNPDTSLYALIAGTIWLWTGFSLVVHAAGLENIPRELYESARIDGASAFRVFWHITVPMLRPATIVVVTMTLITILKIFDIVFTATLGDFNTNTLANLMYFQSFQFYKFGTGAAIASVLTLLVLGFSVYLVRVMVRR